MDRIAGAIAVGPFLVDLRQRQLGCKEQWRRLAAHAHVSRRDVLFSEGDELERSRGFEQPDWEKAAISNLDAFTRLWSEHQDFGHRVDHNTLAIVDPGTAAGALCIGALALGAGLPHGESTFPLHARRVKHFTSDLCAPAGLSLGRWTFPMRRFRIGDGVA